MDLWFCFLINHPGAILSCEISRKLPGQTCFHSFAFPSPEWLDGIRRFWHAKNKRQTSQVCLKRDYAMVTTPAIVILPLLSHPACSDRHDIDGVVQINLGRLRNPPFRAHLSPMPSFQSVPSGNGWKDLSIFLEFFLDLLPSPYFTVHGGHRRAAPILTHRRAIHAPAMLETSKEGPPRRAAGVPL